MSIILVACAILAWGANCSTMPAVASSCASQPVQPLAPAEIQRIEALISGLRWSGTIGSGHGPLFQIRGNSNAEELVRIGKPAVPFLIKALAPVREPNPLAKRTNTIAVTVLGRIGDACATKAILAEMDRQWKDAVFLNAAIAALQAIGDPQASEALLAWGQLSLQVSEGLSGVRNGHGGDPPDPRTADRVQWWIDHEHLSAIHMSTLWIDAFAALGSIWPQSGIARAEKMCRKATEAERLAAAVLAYNSASKDPHLRDRAESVCRKVVAMTEAPDMKEWAAGLLKDTELLGAAQ